MRINLAYDSLRLYIDLSHTLERNILDCDKSLEAAKAVIELQQQQQIDMTSIIDYKDSIIHVRGKQIDKYHMMYKNQYKKTVRTAVGVSVGGFVVGVGVSAMIFLLTVVR